MTLISNKLNVNTYYSEDENNQICDIIKGDSEIEKELLVLSVDGINGRTWHKHKRWSFKYEMERALMKEFPSSHFSDPSKDHLDVDVTSEHEDGNWDLTLTLVSNSLAFEEEGTGFLEAHLQRKRAICKVLDDNGFTGRLQHIHILAFTESMWNHRQNEKREWLAWEREKARRVSDIVREIRQKLEHECKSDSISLENLKEMTRLIPLNFVSGTSFFHQACANKNVTLEIIEFLLDFHPDAPTMEVTETAGSYKRFRGFPLHVACRNQHCPTSVIKLLFKIHPLALTNYVQLQPLLMTHPGTKGQLGAKGQRGRRCTTFYYGKTTLTLKSSICL